MKKHPFLVALGVVLLLGVIALVLLRPFDSGKSGSDNRSRKQVGAKAIDQSATKFGIRWFPDYVHFGPDGDTLLVSLCHVKRSALCRIGKYSIAKNQWVVLPFEENRTYLNPVFSPDGQWIVATRISVDQNINLTREEFRLIKMRPDGSGMQNVGAGISGLGANFSHDGKKLIYWRMYDNPGFPTYDFNLMDWATGTETRLTEFNLFGSDGNRPFLTPDGEKFVFTARLSNVCVKDGNVVMISSIMAARIKDIPLTCENVQEKVEVLWPGEGPNEPKDMDRQGRVLYSGSLNRKKEAGNPVALAIRPKNPDYKDIYVSQEEQKKLYPHLTDEQLLRGEDIVRTFNKALGHRVYQQGGGSAVFLRKPNADAQDEAAFDIYLGISSVSVSPDGKQLSFTSGGTSDRAIGLLKHGDPMRNVRFLDWPKLDLVSSPSQPHAKP